MALPFLSGATGDPINLKRKIAVQAALGVPAAEADYVDFRSYGGPMLLTPGVIDPLVIQQGGEPAKKLLGKIELGGGPFAMGDVDPADEGLIRMLANVCEKYTVTSMDTAEWYRWEFGLREATAADPFLSLLNDNDILPRTRFMDILLGGFTCSAEPGGNFAMEFPMVTGGYDFFGAVSQETGVGGILPVLIKTFPGNWDLDAVDKDIYIRMDVDNGGDNWDLSVKVGSAAAYSNVQTEDVTDWFRLYDEGGIRIGRKAEQILGKFPDTPTLTALDEFKILIRRAVWSPSLGVARKVSSVNTTFIVDGVESRAEGGWNIEWAWANLNSIPDVAGRQTATVERTGDADVTITPTRRIVDLDFQNRLHEATEVQVFFDAETDEIIPGSSNLRPFRIIIGAPACIPEGQMYGVEPGAENRDEAPILKPGVPDSGVVYADGYGNNITFDSHLMVVVDTDIDAI